jgi:hypothetical protein
MTFPVWVSPRDGRYTASILGTPGLNASGETRAAAIESLRTEVVQRMSAGELTFIEVEPKGLLGLAGKYKDDPSLREICEEAYRQRDAERDTEVADANRP